VISDTHGLLRPQALAALAGSHLIIHASDIGKADILPALRMIAPVYGVRGNVDTGEWAKTLPKTEVVEVAGIFLYVLQDVNELDLDPVAAGFAAVISGHSHRPSIEKRNGVLYLNPGSAGPRRFNLPVTVAYLHLQEQGLEAELVELPS
jgi:putative phosphoesterase